MVKKTGLVLKQSFRNSSSLSRIGWEVRSLIGSEGKEKSLTATMDKMTQWLEKVKFEDNQYPAEAKVSGEVARVAVKSVGCGETPREKVEEVNVDWNDEKKTLHVAFADDGNDGNVKAKKIFDTKQGIKGPVVLVAGSDDDMVEAIADPIEKVGGNEKMEEFQLLFTFSSGGKSNLDFATKMNTIAGPETQAKDLAQFVKMSVDDFAYDKVCGLRDNDQQVPRDGVFTNNLDTPHKQGLLTAELHLLRGGQQNYTLPSPSTKFSEFQSRVKYIAEIKDDKTQEMTVEHRYSTSYQQKSPSRIWNRRLRNIVQMINGKCLGGCEDQVKNSMRSSTA